MDTIGNVLQQLIDMIESTAPVLWEILFRQVYVDAFGYLVGVAILIAGGVFAISYAKKINPDDNYDMNAEVGQITLVVFGSLALIIAPFVLIPAIKMLFNPQYYAILDIISRLR